jgi:signal transduction histidine kinase/CheY-like chemotaxis protein/HPt (histidine-containing phosphotransfer) domain-containing protein
LKSGETPAEVYRELWDRIRAGKAWHGEFHNRKKGGELHWERSSIFPIYNAAGQIISFVGLNEDITDSKEAEAEQEREGQLHRALDRLYEPLVSSAACMQDIMVLVLDLVCELTESRQALVETIDPAAESDGENPGVGLVARRGSAGPADAAADERWRQVLDSRRGFFTASPRQSLAAAAPAYLGVPVMAGAELLGRIAVSDPQDEYTEKDLEAVDRLARLFALGILNRRTQEELGRSKEAAEQATRAKSEFLASMSHEIRTPMNAILGLADLTLQGNLDEQQKEDLEQMHASGVSLLQLLNDILDLSKVEASRVELEQVDFHLGETVESAMRTVAEMARTKRLDLRHEIAPGVPQALRGDPHRLRQVLLNLLSNAIKFTDEGQVLVRVVPELAPPGQVGLHFAVEDTGIGIPADRRAMIFDRFTQADPSVTRRHGGTGLGLAIAQGLVDCFGGRIWVESQEGQGSTFHFTVQLERSNAVDTRSEARLTRQEPTALPTWRLLLAEDNAVNQRLVSRLLAGVGWDVKIAQNGREAVEMSAAEEFDAILMDVRMPEMDGMVATQCIRQRERGTEKHIPIVALTADAMRETRERCLEVGMDRYLTKPATPDEMISVVRELVSGTQPPIPAQRGEAEPGQNAVFDLHAAMASVEGDYDLLSEVTQLFLQDLPHQLRTIKVGLENGDLPGVTRAAHTIKGAAATIGAHSLSSVARDMEQAARREDLAFVVSRLPDLRQEGESLVRVLEAEHWRQTT